MSYEIPRGRPPLSGHERRGPPRCVRFPSVIDAALGEIAAERGTSVGIEAVRALEAAVADHRAAGREPLSAPLKTHVDKVEARYWEARRLELADALPVIHAAVARRMPEPLEPGHADDLALYLAGAHQGAVAATALLINLDDGDTGLSAWQEIVRAAVEDAPDLFVSAPLVQDLVRFLSRGAERDTHQQIAARVDYAGVRGRRLMLQAELRKLRLAGEPWPAITPSIGGTSSRIGE